MLIECPYCGRRDLAEFSVLGEARRRPDISGDLDGAPAQAAFVEAVYLREDRAGRRREYWLHAGGCASWLEVDRDARTHEIFAVRLAGEAP